MIQLTTFELNKINNIIFEARRKIEKIFGYEVDLILIDRKKNEIPIMKMGSDMKLRALVDLIETVTITSKGQLTSACRKRTLCDIRHIALHYIRSRTRLSYEEIGAVFGNRDHSTIIHSMNVYSDLYITSTTFRHKADTINNILDRYEFCEGCSQWVAKKGGECPKCLSETPEMVVNLEVL